MGMTKNSDPTKDPEFQRVVQNLLRTPPKPHKPSGKRPKAAKRKRAKKEKPR
jgi:hypothetical protein